MTHRAVIRARAWAAALALVLGGAEAASDCPPPAPPPSAAQWQAAQRERAMSACSGG